jgi:hypothetical protein
MQSIRRLSRAAVERAMKVQGVILRAVGKKIGKKITQYVIDQVRKALPLGASRV